MISPAKDTRQALLDAGQSLFSSRGYADVSTREIAESARANLGSIQYHFGSKRALYLATVHRVMTHDEPGNPWALLDETLPQTAEAAALRLTRFVRTYLNLLLGPDPPQPCGMLMLWEALRPSEAIDTVVEEYIRPNNNRLRSLILTLLHETDTSGAAMFAQSVLAQILHYRVFDSFIKRLADQDNRALHPGRATAHLVRFSLRAMGYDDEFINRVLEQANETSVSDQSTSVKVPS